MTRCSPASRSARALLREQRAVRGEREIEAAEPREHLDQALEVLAQQRLAAGQADLLDAVLLEDPREARDLLEAEHLARAAGTRSPAPNTSFGMQYVQRKLQRSVTEMRRSRSGRAERVDDLARRGVPSPDVGEGHCAARIDERDDAVGHGSLFIRPGSRMIADRMPVHNQSHDTDSSDKRMPAPSLPVAVIMERRALANRWQSERGSRSVSYPTRAGRASRASSRKTASARVGCTPGSRSSCIATRPRATT